MFRKNTIFKTSSIIFAAAILLAVLAATSFPTTGQAHCDDEKGPVVTSAKQALERGDVKLILPYVKPEYEAELIEAFKHSLQVRKLSPEAEELADGYFSEVAVRLHRAGEGAAYTGLKDEAIPPVLLAADKAMQSGSMKELSSFLDTAIKDGLKDRYAAVQTARKEADRLGIVEAMREKVEAELGFEKYVYELYLAATAAGMHAEGAAVEGSSAEGHSH